MSLNLLWFLPAGILYIFLWCTISYDAGKNRDNDILEAWFAFHLIVLTIVSLIIGVSKL